MAASPPGITSILLRKKEGWAWRGGRGVKEEGEETGGERKEEEKKEERKKRKGEGEEAHTTVSSLEFLHSIILFPPPWPELGHMETASCKEVWKIHRLNWTHCSSVRKQFWQKGKRREWIWSREPALSAILPSPYSSTHREVQLFNPQCQCQDYLLDSLA